jgi:hypothetical protein
LLGGAPGEGFEPPLTAPKAAVLPLDEPGSGNPCSLVSLARNSPHISAPGRRLAAFSSSPLALLAASSSALRCIHPATNLCTEFLARHTRLRCSIASNPVRRGVPGRTCLRRCLRGRSLATESSAFTSDHECDRPGGVSAGYSRGRPGVASSCAGGKPPLMPRSLVS